MKIEKISYSEKNTSFYIYLDNKESFLCSYEKYEDLKLKKGDKINEFIYDKLVLEDQYIRGRNIALNFIDYKMRTSFEIKNRLYKEFIDKDIIEQIIYNLEKNNFLNDDYYAKNFIESRIFIRRWSKKKTKFKLLERGINSSVSDKYLDEIDPDVELENAIYLLEKRYKNINLKDIKEKNKIYRYMSSNGFNFYDIEKALRMINNE